MVTVNQTDKIYELEFLKGDLIYIGADIKAKNLEEATQVALVFLQIPEDSERGSERSRIIAPALQQAVESNVAELEEATFGRGKWFDIADDTNDKDRQDVQYLRNKLTEDFEKCKVRKAVAECLINSAVFGTGIGEVVLEEIKEMAPATQPIMNGDLAGS